VHRVVRFGSQDCPEIWAFRGRRRRRDLGVSGSPYGFAPASRSGNFVVALRFRGVDSGPREESAQGKGEAESVRVAGVGRAIAADLLDAA
jgi:hypothetical protein